MPNWNRVDAAVELPGGTRILFGNEDSRAIMIPPTGRVPAQQPTNRRWGLRPTVLPVADTAVDAVLVRGEATFVCYGGQYVRFTGTPFGRIDDGYPRLPWEAHRSEEP
jgi:hypothetical protein